jgi:hypothetical protein
MRNAFTTGFNIPSVLGESYGMQSIRDAYVHTRYWKRRMGLEGGRLLCPQCRMKRHIYMTPSREALREHLLEHRIARALGTEQALIQQGKPMKVQVRLLKNGSPV